MRCAFLHISQHAIYLACRGDYDMVVAMYHDQGHGPIKVLGVDRREHHGWSAGDPHLGRSCNDGALIDIRWWIIVVHGEPRKVPFR